VDFVHQFFDIGVPKKDSRGLNRHFADANLGGPAACALHPAAGRGKRGSQTLKDLPGLIRRC